MDKILELLLGILSRKKKPTLAVVPPEPEAAKLPPPPPVPMPKVSGPTTRPSNIGSEGLRLIKEFEGCKLAAYRDSVGILTIGYGHTLGVLADQVITQQRADELLEQDIQATVKGVLSLISVPLNQNQLDALVCFAFNVGVGRLKNSTLRLKLNLGDYKGAAEEFLRWDKAGGVLLVGLTRRRKAERELFLKPSLVG